MMFACSPARGAAGPAAESWQLSQLRRSAALSVDSTSLQARRDRSLRSRRRTLPHHRPSVATVVYVIFVLTSFTYHILEVYLEFLCFSSFLV